MFSFRKIRAGAPPARILGVGPLAAVVVGGIDAAGGGCCWCCCCSAAPPPPMIMSGLLLSIVGNRGSDAVVGVGVGWDGSWRDGIERGCGGGAGLKEDCCDGVWISLSAFYISLCSGKGICG